MVEQLIAEGIRDKQEIKHQFADVTTITGSGTVVALPIFKIQDKEEINLKDRALIAKTRLVHTGTDSCFVLGHPVHGLLGATAGTQPVLGDSNAGAYGTVRIVHPNNIYREWFYDDEFYNSVDGTGTWDTTNHRATLDTSSTVTSNQFFMNSATVTTAVLTATYVGTATFDITADGTNWETVTNGTSHTFASVGTTPKWRARTGTASPATITLLNIEFATS